MENYIVDINVLAKIFNKTTKMIHNYVADGMPKEGTNKYDLIQCVRWYIRREIDKRGGEETTVELNRKLLKVNTELKELELKQLRGELLEIGVVMSAFEKVVIAVKNKLLSLPHKCAGVIIGFKNINEVKDYLDSQVREILEELSIEFGTYNNKSVSEGNQATAEDKSIGVG